MKKNSLKKYYDSISQVYALREQSRYHRWLNEQTLHTLTQWLPLGPTLDAGCGCGHIATPLSQMEYPVTGIDLSLNMLKQFKIRSPETDCIRAQTSLYQLPFADDSFSSAYSLRVFPHLTHPTAILAELARVVRPGGTIVVDVYQRYSIRTAVKQMLSMCSSAQEYSIPTRFDTLTSFTKMLPPSLSIQNYSGIRILIPAGCLLSCPLLGHTLTQMENLLHRSPLTRFGGFLMIKLTVTDQS